MIHKWFLAISLLTAAAFIGGCSPEFRAGAAPYLSAIAPRSITISWFAASEGMCGVSYWASESPESKQTAVASQPVSPWRHVSIRLDGLLPQTRYFYQIFNQTIDGGIMSPRYSFTTAPEDKSTPFFFWVYADTQNRERHGEVVAQMLKSPDAAFLLHCGDMVNIPTPRQWADFFSAAAPVLNHVPLYPIYGNHDAHNKEMHRLFPLLAHGFWYSFNYGPLHIVAIDSTSDFSPGSEQYKWLEEDLDASASCPWKIAFFHHPPFSPNSRDITPAARRFLCPLLERSGVTLVFNSHSHIYHKYSIGPVQYVITGGGGGWSITREPSQYNAPYHFVRVDVSLNELTITAIRSDGSIADQFTVERDK